MGLLMVVTCMCCGAGLGVKSAEGGRHDRTSGICEGCLDGRYPEYAERVRALRGESCLRLAS